MFNAIIYRNPFWLSQLGQEVVVLACCLIIQYVCSETISNVVYNNRHFVLVQSEFQTSTTIREVRDGDITIEISIMEHYSAEMARARLSTAEKHYIYDVSLDAYLIFEPQIRSCELTTPQSIDKDLGLSILERLLRDSGLVEDLHAPLIPKYVVGPARVLFLAAAHASKMTELTVKEQSSKANTVLGRTCRVLELSNQSARALVYYDLNTADTKVETGLPISVRLSSMDGKDAVLIDFGSIKTVPELIRTSSAASFGLEKWLEPLTLPLASGCAELLTDRGLVDAYPDLKVERLQLSFRAIGKGSPEAPVTSYFVAMDGTSSLIRIDSEPSQMKTYSTSVLDLRTNRKYIATHEKSVAVQTRVGGDSYDPDEVSCMVTEIAESDKDKQNTGLYVDVGAFLLGSHAFVFMGYCRIQGTRVKIYESSSSTHPSWIDQSLLYKDRTGKFLTRWQLFKDHDVNLTTYTTVVYMTDIEVSSGINLSRPMQIEIYRKFSSLDLQRFQLTAYAQINDFKFTLAPAPDGSSGSELFSIPHLCSNLYDRYVEINMDLDVQMPKQVDLPMDYQWLKSSEMRNLAMVQIVARTRQLSVPMMYDVNSQLIQVGERYKIQLSFRVAEHPRYLYDLQFVGNAKSLTKASITGWASSLDHCLHWIGSSRRTGQVYIILTGNVCELETSVPTKSESLSNPPAFELDKNGKSQVFLVKSRADDQLARNHGWLSQLSVNHFDRLGFSTYAPRLDPTNQMHRSTSNFKLTKIEIVGHNFEADGDRSKPADNVVSLPGFKLVSGSDKVSVPKGRASGFVMNLERCQRACLSDTECKSYSFCNTWPGFECLLSASVQLNRYLVIEAKKSSIKAGERLPTMAKDHYSGELIKDPRCNSYNKNFVSQFRRAMYSKIDLSDHNTSQVSSINECARLCYDLNMGVFSRDISAGTELGYEKLAELTKLDREERIKLVDMHRQNRQRFCTAFAYIPAPLSEDVNQLVASCQSNSINGASNGSLCLTKVPFDSSNSRRKNIFVQAEVYDFEYAKLFEVTGSVALLGDATPEGRAYKTPNSQYSNFFLSADECAKNCVLQTTHVSPACRSYDIIRRRNEFQIQCVYNSMTYAELEKASKDQNGTKVEFTWSNEKKLIQHFEPFAGKIAAELQLGSFWNGLESDWMGLPINERATRARDSAVGNLGFMLLLCLCLALGVYLGTKVDQGLPDLFSDTRNLRRYTQDIGLVDANSLEDVVSS